MARLRTRVVLAALLALAVTMAVSGIVVVSSFASRERRNLDNQLVKGAIEAERETKPAPQTVQPSDTVRGAPGGRDAERLAQTLTESGEMAELVQGTTTIATYGAPIPHGGFPAAHGINHLETVTVEGRHFRSINVPAGAPAARQAALMELAAPLGPIEARIAALRRWVIGVGLAGLVLAGFATWFLVGFALRSLERLRAAAAGLGDTDERDVRLPTGTGPLEVDQLATTLNTMLDRQYSALEATRRFAADAGHELRTPLTAMRTNLEVLQTQELDPAQRAQIVSELAADHHRLSALLEALQALARGDASEAVPREEIDVGDLVDAAVQAAQRRHPETRFALGGADAPPLLAWPDGLRLAVDNLLENAARHGRRGGSVRAEVQATNGTLTIAVEDDGPGIPEHERDAVLDRFVRGAAAAGEGSGLGLALVAQQAVLHGGRVAIDRASLGGARVALVLDARSGTAGVTA